MAAYSQPGARIESSFVALAERLESSSSSLIRSEAVVEIRRADFISSNASIAVQRAQFKRIMDMLSAGQV